MQARTKTVPTGDKGITGIELTPKNERKEKNVYIKKEVILFL